MTVIRAQVVLAATSALPKDAVSNTFHFDTAGVPTQQNLEDAALAAISFYNSVEGANPSVGSYLASSIADSGHQVRCYTYDELGGDRLSYPDAPPEYIEAFSIANRGSELLGLPNEVALCVSFRNVADVQVPLARRTGRIYFGPIEGNMTVAGPSGFPIPHSNIIRDLLDAGERLRTESVALGVPLCVWSRNFAGRAEIVRPGRPTLPALPARDGAAYLVDQVFIDDEFDTQRRRGRGAGTRTITSF